MKNGSSPAVGDASLAAGEAPLFKSDATLFIGDAPLLISDATLSKSDAPLLVGDASLFKSDAPLFIKMSSPTAGATSLAAGDGPSGTKIPPRFVNYSPPATSGSSAGPNIYRPSEIHTAYA